MAAPQPAGGDVRSAVLSRIYNLDWAYVAGPPPAEALLKLSPEDFCVDEELGFEPCGEGEHVYLHLRKRGDNTAWLARQIARLANVESRDVGFCGLKDRNAVTRQWFSIYLPKAEEPDWYRLASDSVSVLQVTRHRQKLRRGTHSANRFKICLRQILGVDGADLQQRLARVAEQGVPNYFGPQRFGIDGNNLREAERLLVEGGKIRNRQQRGLILSAARAYLFNLVLDSRVRDGSWLLSIEGEPLIDGLPSGPLWGRGRLAGSLSSVELEEAVLRPWHAWCEGLEHVGLQQERRRLLCRPQDFRAQLQSDGLQVEFRLPPGGFATTVLREICRLKEASEGVL